MLQEFYHFGLLKSLTVLFY